MSADNWAICPRCKEKKKVADAKRLSDVEDQYGKVSSEVYIELRQEADAVVSLSATLREDFDIGVDDETGQFSVNYHCRCDMCGLQKQFEHNLTIEDMESEDGR